MPLRPGRRQREDSSLPIHIAFRVARSNQRTQDLAELDTICFLAETDEMILADQDVPADHPPVIKVVLPVPMTDEGFEHGGPGSLTRQVHEFRASMFVCCGKVSKELRPRLLRVG